MRTMQQHSRIIRKTEDTARVYDYNKSKSLLIKAQTLQNHRKIQFKPCEHRSSNDGIGLKQTNIKP